MSVVLMIPRVDSGPAGDACALHSCRRKIREVAESKPFDARPSPPTPPTMHGIGINGHQAVSELAAAAGTAGRERALAFPLNSTSACVASHFSYRTR